MCKKMLVDLGVGTEMEKLAITFFNKAVSIYNTNQYDVCIKWLMESLDLFEKDKNRDAIKQARSLRLLSSCHLEMKNLDTALVTCQMANKQHKSAHGLNLQAKINFMLQRESEGLKLLLESINHADSNLNLYALVYSLIVL